MTRSSSLFQSTRSSVVPYGAAIYTHPSDVTSNPKLTTAEKRAVLASWISDARAVENAPSLRRLDSGAGRGEGVRFPAPNGTALRGGSALGLPFPARRAAPGEAVIASRGLAGDDDMMPYQMARHAT